MKNTQRKIIWKSKFGDEAGVSMVELTMVLVIIGILATMSVFYLTAYQKLYKPDDQALKIVDIIQEARQRALTERRTMRVEVDLTSNSVKLIDENISSTTSSDDKIIKQATLFVTTDVRVDSRPTNITVNPPEVLTIPAAQFKASIHPLSVGHTVCTVRFLRDGSVVNEGLNDIGVNAVTAGLTLFVWSPSKSNPSNSDITRAITIIGATGSIKYWEYNPSATTANKWKDSRRVGYVFGGSGSGGSNANVTPTP